VRCRDNSRYLQLDVRMRHADVAANAEPHRSDTDAGATLFIVD
jgi:hypothetical protein